MAKLLLVALALATLVAFQEVSAHRTITTTTIEEDDISNPRGRGRGGSQERCQQQLQRQRFNSCQRYLSQQGGYYGDMIEMPVENPRQQGQQELNQCCQELQNVDEQCQCEAIRQAARQAMQRQQQGGREGGRRGSQQQQVFQRAQRLPQDCGLETQQCQIRSPWVF